MTTVRALPGGTGARATGPTGVGLRSLGPTGVGLRSLGPTVVVLALAVVTALVAGVLVATSDAVAGELRLVQATDARVVGPEGVSRPAVPGAVLHDGDRLETGPGGSAVLQRRAAEVLVAPASRLALESGDLVLEAGDVALDAREASLPRLRTADLDLRVGSASVLRVASDRAVRVSVLVGEAEVRPRDGSDDAVVDVPALHEVHVAAGVLPRSVDPLRLRRDPLEERVIPTVLVLDRALATLADAVSPAEARAALPAVAGFAPELARAVTPASAPAAPGAAPAAAAAVDPQPAGPSAASEQGARAVFVVALARAAQALDEDPAARARAVSDLHRRSGSWGVVSSLVEADLQAVDGALQELLAGIRTAGLPAAAAADATGAAPGAEGTTPAPGTPASAAGGAPAPAGDAPTGAAPPAAPTGPTAPAAPVRPAPQPVPAAPAVPRPPVTVPPVTVPLPEPVGGAVDGLGDAVDDVLEGVGGVLRGQSAQGQSAQGRAARGRAAPGQAARGPAPRPSGRAADRPGVLHGLPGAP